MKLSTKIQKLKHRTPQAGGPKPQGRAPQRSWRNAVIAVLCALAAFAGTWALFEYVIWNTVPPALVGKWVVTQGPQEGATFDFFRGGTMVGRVNAGGNEHIINARIRVEDRKIFSTTVNPNTGRDETRVLAIRRLSATDLVIEDAESGVLEMERAP